MRLFCLVLLLCFLVLPLGACKREDADQSPVATGSPVTAPPDQDESVLTEYDLSKPQEDDPPGENENKLTGIGAWFGVSSWIEKDRREAYSRCELELERAARAAHKRYHFAGDVCGCVTGTMEKLATGKLEKAPGQDAFTMAFNDCQKTGSPDHHDHGDAHGGHGKSSRSAPATNRDYTYDPETGQWSN